MEPLRRRKSRKPKDRCARSTAGFTGSLDRIIPTISVKNGSGQKQRDCSESARAA
jgi:hypothetical protein